MCGCRGRVAVLARAYGACVARAARVSRSGDVLALRSARAEGDKCRPSGGPSSAAVNMLRHGRGVPLLPPRFAALLTFRSSRGLLMERRNSLFTLRLEFAADGHVNRFWLRPHMGRRACVVRTGSAARRGDPSRHVASGIWPSDAGEAQHAHMGSWGATRGCLACCRLCAFRCHQDWIETRQKGREAPPESRRGLRSGSDASHILSCLSLSGLVGSR